MMSDLIERFAKSIQAFDLGGATVRVALSGGCDSVALAELLYRVFERERLAALHVDHGIREGSGDDAVFVREFCEERGIPLEIKNVDAPGHAETRGIGIEEAARELRYRVFDEYIGRGEFIATAHTSDDTIETLLFNLTRGAGPRGLAGIPRERDGIIRPLLNFFRRDLEKWLETEGINWRRDESNLDLRYTRNRVRWMLIPEIKRVFGEGVMERLRREADIFSACSEFIDRQAEVIFEEAVISRFGDIIAFDSARALSSFWGFGEIVRKGLIELGISLQSIGFDTIERLWADIETSRKGRWYPIAEGAHLEYDDSIFFVFANRPNFEPLEIEIEQEIQLPDRLGILKASKKPCGVKVSYGGGKLCLRAPKPGDSRGSQKLLRHMSRRGVPGLLRKSVPVLFEGEIPLFSPILGKFTVEPSLFELYIKYEGPLGRDLLIKT